MIECQQSLYFVSVPGANEKHMEKKQRRQTATSLAAYQLDAGDILGLVVVGNASSYRVRASETEQLAEATPVCYLSVWIC